MTRPNDSLTALREQAVAGVEHLVEIIGLGVTLGASVPAEHAVRQPFTRVGGCDISGFLADSHRLATAYQLVSEQLHRLPEQSVRLDQGWRSAAGSVMIAAVVEHQRRAEADLQVLRTLSEATSAAAVGIDRLLRTWYLAVARLSQPLIGGVPIAEVPAAILRGALPVGIVVDDIVSRCEMYLTSAKATVDGVDDILSTLNRATDELDAEPYFAGPNVMPTADPAPAPDSSRAHPDHQASAPASPQSSVQVEDLPLRLTPLPDPGTAPEPSPEPAGASLPQHDQPQHDSPQHDQPHPDPAQQHGQVPDVARTERTKLAETPSTDAAPIPAPPSRPGKDPGADLALAGDQ